MYNIYVPWQLLIDNFDFCVAFQTKQSFLLMQPNQFLKKYCLHIVINKTVQLSSLYFHFCCILAVKGPQKNNYWQSCLNSTNSGKIGKLFKIIRPPLPPPIPHSPSPYLTSSSQQYMQFDPVKNQFLYRAHCTADLSYNKKRSKQLASNLGYLL